VEDAEFLGEADGVVSGVKFIEEGLKSGGVLAFDDGWIEVPFSGSKLASRGFGTSYGWGKLLRGGEIELIFFVTRVFAAVQSGNNRA
jgi:hypothetical protein